jgi:hypothetical protein
VETIASSSMAIYQFVEIDVLPEKSLPIDQSHQLINGAQQISKFSIRISLNSQKMAESSESTPFLASNDRPDDTNARNDALPANAHFKRPIKILTICASIASVLGAIFLTASFITVQAAPFTPFPGYTYGARFILQELGTCVSAGNFL